MLVKERDGVKLFKDYSREGSSGYVYWIGGLEDKKVFSYREAQNLFQQAVTATLERGEGDCPKCGGVLHTVGLGTGMTHRWAKQCSRCGYLEDELDTDRIQQILEQAGAVKKDVPNHREGRIGTKEILQGNTRGHDSQFD